MRCFWSQGVLQRAKTLCGQVNSQTHRTEAKKPQDISSSTAAVRVAQGLWMPRRQKVQVGTTRSLRGGVGPQSSDMGNGVSSEAQGSWQRGGA